MISNAELADQFSLAAKLLELQNGDERRIKTYANAAYVLERFENPLYEMDVSQYTDIQGIGKTLASRITEIIATGSFAELNELLAATPTGVIDLFKVKGLGVKKVKQLWQEIGIDSLEKLRKASERNEIAQLKGFGERTQQAILASLDFIDAQRGKVRLHKGLAMSEEISGLLRQAGYTVHTTGQAITGVEVIDTLSFIIETEALADSLSLPQPFVKDWAASAPTRWSGFFDDHETRVQLFVCPPGQLAAMQLRTTATEEHLLAATPAGPPLFSILRHNPNASIEAMYEAAGTAVVPAELRHSAAAFDWIKEHTPNDLITQKHLKGCVHNHSTYSDGRHTLRQMAEYCQSLGLSYFGIADHSQTATYANGLPPARVRQQHDEIDALNAEFSDFRILKGIESDILLDGSLDYDDEVLASFDYVVASVHSTLSMDMVKATDRLIKAIQNPYTTILGHPTGRLLLAREGYPVDYQAVIDACAAYGVVMELNANPYRLDLDWRWLPYCQEKGVPVSINPDAHATGGIHDMAYGVHVARRGALLAKNTFNALTLDEMTAYLATRRTRQN